ncbi:MAG: hypothetical protein EOM93_05965 [Gammaproteobacteria bacterium]|nr:hypothetical protein [Gammaproteobacteria bacterium]
MLTIPITYNSATRLITYNANLWGGTTEDNRSVEIEVAGIEALVATNTIELVFGVPLYNNRIIYYPSGKVDAITYKYQIPNQILAAATDGVLPIELRLTAGSVVTTSRNRVNLDIHEALDALGPITEAYKPDILGKTSQWSQDVQYAKDAIVIHNGVLFYSTRSDNINHEPTTQTIIWWKEVEVIAVHEYEILIGDGVTTTFDVEHDLHTVHIQLSIRGPDYTDLTNTLTNVTVTDTDNIVLIFGTAPPANTNVRINESYRIINNDLLIRGDITAFAINTPYMYADYLETNDSKVKVSNGTIGVDASGNIFGGTEGHEKILATDADLDAHTGNTNNPHSVTKSQIGLGNCDDTSDTNKPLSNAAIAKFATKADAVDLNNHLANISNPHHVTVGQIGAVPANPLIQGGFFPKIRYDANGLVVDGEPLSSLDVPPHSADLLTTGTVPDERLPSTAERIINRMTAWNNNPLDTKYPSEKLVFSSLAKKADITEGVEQWSAAITYSAGAITNIGGVLYASLVSNNIGFDPTSTTDKWIKYVASSTADPALQDSYVTTVGDGTSDTITITHGLNSRDVIVQPYILSDEYPTIEIYAARINVNQVKLVFSHAPALNSMRVLVSRPGTSVRTVNGNVGEVVLDYADVGAVAANAAITGATKCKVTYDAKGLVTAGADLAASDVPDLDASKTTSGTFNIARIPVVKYAGTIIGNGTDKTFTFAHGLGGVPLSVMIQTSDGRIVDTQTVLSATNIVLDMTSAPATGETFTITAIRW